MDNYNETVISEQMDSIINTIDNCRNNKIILSGENKCGKSKLLKYYVRNYNSNKCILYCDYKDFNYKPTLGSVEYDFYYELIFVRKMLDSLYLYNNDIYSNFRVFSSYISRELSKFYEFLMTRVYVNDKLEFEKGSLVKSMFEIFKLSNIKNVSLIIDHFDFVGESSEVFQNFMKEYFDLFNKVIVTTNDVMNNDKKERLNAKGYDIVSVSFGGNLDVIKNIINRYLDKLEHGYIYDLNHLLRLHEIYKMSKDDSFYYNLMNRCGDNLDMMIQSVRGYILGLDINKAIDTSINLQNEIDSLTFRRILHL